MSPIRHLLVADDDRALSSILSAALREEGYEVTVVGTGLKALQEVERAAPDLLILDVLMPEMDGLEVCRRVRKRSRVPIILLTSRGEEVDRVTGLETGADDYVTKPFSTRELCARIRAIERRLEPGPAAAGGSGGSGAGTAESFRAGDLEVDPARFEVRWKGKPVVLTRSEFQIVSALVRRRGRVLGREQLLELARGDGVVVTDRTVDTFIKRIRKKIREGADPGFDEIETVIGMGYRCR